MINDFSRAITQHLIHVERIAPVRIRAVHNTMSHGTSARVVVVVVAVVLIVVAAFQIHTGTVVVVILIITTVVAALTIFATRQRSSGSGHCRTRSS